MLDRKGILSFLGITFGVTYAVEFGLIASGVRFNQITASTLYAPLVIALVMWVPAAAALITAKFITGEGYAGLGLRFGPVKPYLLWMLVYTPLIFAAIYGLTWLTGIAQPDWTLQAFITQTVEAAGGEADLSTMPPPPVVLTALFFGTTLAAPLINGVFGFGEELGWRGYLLPKLLPLGKPRAYLLLGVIWALWHLPLILVGYNYPGYPALGIVWFMALLTLVGVVFSELRLRYRSSLLAGWLHGLFNSQRGFWAVPFPVVNPLLGGFTGLAGIVVWGAAAAIILLRRDEPEVPIDAPHLGDETPSIDP